MCRSPGPKALFVLILLLSLLVACPRPTPPPEPEPTVLSRPLATPEGLGDIWTRPADEGVTVYVPGGEFQMGSNQSDSNERPVHVVRLDSFWIDKYEVTSTQYRRCVEAGECQAPTTCGWGEPTYGDAARALHPVVCVDWYGADVYCKWAGGRLPTEAEWEYAARGPQRNVYPWGDEFDCTRGNFDDETEVSDYVVPGGEGCDGYTRTAPVGKFEEGISWCGAHDMAGNVDEWVNDWYQEDYYSVSPYSNPPGPAKGGYKVLRGGSWSTYASADRSACRSSKNPQYRHEVAGFRCVVSATP